MPDKKEVGRELDAEIATRVMGINPAWIHFEHGGRTIDLGGSFGPVLVAACERYSAIIRPAFDAVEKMRADGWYFTIGTHVMNGGWFVRVWNETHKDGFEAAEDTLPHALCLASLAACDNSNSRSPSLENA